MFQIFQEDLKAIKYIQCILSFYASLCCLLRMLLMSFVFSPNSGSNILESYRSFLELIDLLTISLDTSDSFDMFHFA